MTKELALVLFCGFYLLPFFAVAFVPTPTSQHSFKKSNVFVLGKALFAQGGISDEKTNKPTTKRRTWDESYALLLEFYDEHGHANVPYKYTEDPKLGTWLNNLRKRRHRLSPENNSKLEALNITWDRADKVKSDQRWEDLFLSLEEYQLVEGHCCVPYKYPPNQKLGYWVDTQRKRHRMGKLTPYRVKKLESIGFVWRLKRFFERERGDYEEQWDSNFEELLEFRKENGHCRVPYYEKGRAPNPLGSWVNGQRRKNADGLLRQDRKERLEEISFTWDFEEIYDESWQKMYNQLIELKDMQPTRKGDGKSGHFAWSTRTKQPELYWWELAQHDYYKRGSLDSKRESMLDEIGYWSSLGLQKDARAPIPADSIS